MHAMESNRSSLASTGSARMSLDDEDLQSLPPPPVAVVDAEGQSLESFEARSGGTFDGMRVSDSQMSFGSDLLMRTSQLDDLDLLPLQGAGSLGELVLSGGSDFDQALEMRLSGGNYANPPAMAPPAPPSDVEPETGGAAGEEADVAGDAAGGARKPPRPRKPPDAQGGLVMGLPTSKDGRPKPAPPWIAAAVYWIATQPELQSRTGLTVTPAVDKDTPAVFHIVSLSVKDKAKSRELDNGVVLARMVREIMKLTGSGLKVPCWDAVRKHLSPIWWSNPTRGGNKNRDFSQSYLEHESGSFASQGELLAATHPQLLKEAVASWEMWYAEELAARHAQLDRPAEAGGDDGGDDIGAETVQISLPQ